MQRESPISGSWSPHSIQNSRGSPAGTRQRQPTTRISVKQDRRRRLAAADVQPPCGNGCEYEPAGLWITATKRPALWISRSARLDVDGDRRAHLWVQTHLDGVRARRLDQVRD